MRVICLLLLLYRVASVSVEAESIFKTTKVKETCSVSLRGQVESIEVKSSSASSIMLTVNLKMELLNNGTKPVIFLEAKPPNLSGGVLAKNPNPNDFSSANRLVLQYYGESVDTSSEWIILRDALNQPSPPLDKVRILQPNELWEWKDVVSIAMPTEANKRSYFDDKRESWENVKQLSTGWLQAICQVWSLNLEPLSRDRTEKTFGRKLQRRWKDVGLLLLDNVYSEPIRLDLKTATYKTASP